MADKKNTTGKAKAEAGDKLPADEAKGQEPVEASRSELPLETVKSDGIVAPVEIEGPAPPLAPTESADEGPEMAPATPEPVIGQPEEEGFAVNQHVEYARRIYKQEPWLVKTVLREYAEDDVVTKDTVRDLISVFLSTPVE